MIYKVDDVAFDILVGGAGDAHRFVEGNVNMFTFVVDGYFKFYLFVINTNDHALQPFAAGYGYNTVECHTLLSN